MKYTFVKEKKILFFVVLVIFFCEFLFAFSKEELSDNIKHIKTIPQISDRIKGTEKQSLLFIGNSLIGEAIDTSILRSILSKNNRYKSFAIERIVPDGTGLLDWYFILKNFFVMPNKIPDMVIIGFAWKNSLSDQYPINQVRLADFACKMIDLPELSDFGLNSIEGKTEFIVAKISSIYSNRSIIRNRLLSNLIPYYQTVTQSMNEDSNLNLHSNNKNDLIFSYNRFQRLLSILRENDICALFVAMPIIDNYEIDEEIEKMIYRSGMLLVDCRFTPELSTEMFKDKMHLNEKGRVKFSRYLAKQIKDTNKIQ